MSFRCDNCKQAVDSGIPMNKVVVKTREKVYPRRTKIVEGWMSQEVTLDSGGIGWETVKELSLCKDCAAKYNGGN